MFGAREEEMATSMPSGEQPDAAQSANRFGHRIDPAVGYARGPVLSSSLEEAKRRSHAQALIRERAKALGRGCLFNFTGHNRDYPVGPDRVAWGEEWVGPAYFWEELVDLAREHFGGGSEHEVFAFNRCSAGIISTCLALARPGSTVASVVPGNRSHPSIGRGARLAGARLRQTRAPSELAGWLAEGNVSLVVVTGVSSELQILDQDVLLEVVGLGREARVPVLLDDAYGTRLRPIIFDGPKTLETGVDVGVTACDKAGMGGPRAGLMVGEPRLMVRIAAKAAELGLEARPPLALGIWASLRQFDPKHLRAEVDTGLKIYEQLSERYGPDRVIASAYGASIAAEDAYELVQARSRGDFPIVPAEVTAGVGLHWLAHHGIISVNAMGQPGASIWLRFKPAPDEVERFGGVSALVGALDEALGFVAQRAQSIEEMRRLILGE